MIIRALIALALLWFPVSAANAQEIYQLSPDALEKVRQTSQKMAPRIERQHTHELRADGPETKTGVSFIAQSIYVGRYRKVVSPATGRLQQWAFDAGLFVNRLQDRYAGTFYFFFDPRSERRQAATEVTSEGTYILVGTEMLRDGSLRTGIFKAEQSSTKPLAWSHADPEWLAQFERDNKAAVERTKAMIRKRQAEDRAAAASGFSFGQLLALGLGAGGLAFADIPTGDMIQIGSAFASDVLSKGQTTQLNDLVASKRPGPAATTTANAGQTPTPAAGGYTTEKVRITCASGVSNTVPLTFKTRTCRNAMENYARVYACNLIDDMQAAAQRCKQACGHIQCAE
ncbi:MAG: hypothetical protein JJ959_16280 [Nisaea sp.]|uniref:hypothetical protein n=1 Tax=Nisaea sp. TaxID=2024842 RepID=UPI001B1F67A5|nr:hypothetical protein [Nisaea sp.]MBO6562103.1 hypothetical protein [Nisaea sp.]